MTHDQAFLEAIRDSPHDDTPRLVYADWLEEHGNPDRAEFIRVQCTLSRMRSRADDWQRLSNRARELLALHWEEWVGPIRELVGPNAARLGEAWVLADKPSSQPSLGKFSRGFVEVLSLEAERFLNPPVPIASVLPLRHLNLWGAGRLAGQLAAAPALAGLSGLAFRDYFGSPLDAAGMKALANSPHLGRLTSLYLYRNDLGDDGVRALADAPWLAGLRGLDLGHNGLSAEGVRALALAAPPLAYLSLGNNAVGQAGAEALAGSPLLSRLHELSLASCELDGDALAVLLASRHLGQLASLDLKGNPLNHRGAAVLASAPPLLNVTTLDLSRCGLDDEDMEVLARSPYLAAIESLQLNENAITDQGAQFLARSSHLGRLTTLGLRFANITGAGRKALFTGQPQLLFMDLYD
jgi:uncharacterized protein (TIGR02996 family)